jgi:hypothetical protein
LLFGFPNGAWSSIGRFCDFGRNRLDRGRVLGVDCGWLLCNGTVRNWLWCSSSLRQRL